MSNFPTIFQSCETKGRQLYEDLDQVLRDPAAADIVCAPISLAYELAMLPGVRPLMDPAEEEALEEENLGAEAYTHVAVYNRPMDASTVFPYCNYFSPTLGAIVCAFNDKSLDYNSPEHRLQWSQVMFQIWQELCQNEGIAVRELKTVWRHKVANDTTDVVITTALSDRRPPFASDDRIEFFPNDPAFYALLGSPNGSGVARMLTEFPISFGRKTISSVRIVNERSAMRTLCWFLQDHPEGLAIQMKQSSAPDGPQSRKQRRQNKKRQRASDPFFLPVKRPRVTPS